MHRPWRLLSGQGGRSGALALLVCLVLWGPALAQRTTMVRAPAAALPQGAAVLQLPLPLPAGTLPPPPSGLKLAIDMNWVEGPGYHPVRVTVSPTVTVPFDRLLQVRLRLPRQWADRYALTVSRDILIPGGTRAGA